MDRTVSATMIVTGNFKNTGFGFSCMQQAVNLGIEGTFEYINMNEVRIRVSGSREALEAMVSWCRRQEITKKVTISYAEHEPEHYHGFEILNLLENGQGLGVRS